jgi:hypothetical protein
MAWAQEDVDVLERAIAKGSVLQSITVANGQMFTFRSLDEMRRLLADMKREVATGGRSRTRYAATSKGV